MLASEDFQQQKSNLQWGPDTIHNAFSGVGSLAVWRFKFTEGLRKV